MNVTKHDTSVSLRPMSPCATASRRGVALRTGVRAGVFEDQQYDATMTFRRR